MKDNDQSESDSNSEAETIEKENTFLANLDHMQLHVVEAGEMRKLRKEKNMLSIETKYFPWSKRAITLISNYS